MFGRERELESVFVTESLKAPARELERASERVSLRERLRERA